MGRRWVRRKKQKTEPAHNSLVAGYGSSDDDESDGEAASPWEKHVDAATGKKFAEALSAHDVTRDQCASRLQKHREKIKSNADARATL